MWHSTATVYRLRLQRGTTAEHIGQWIAQLAAILRVPRWWDIAPRWPVVIELMATEHGVERLVVIPARMRARVAASLAAALPGARLEDSAQPVHAAYRWINAGEVRLHGKQRLLAVDRIEDTSRHVLASLQPLRSGELIRVQWLLVGARVPRAVSPDSGNPPDRARVSRAVVEDRQQLLVPTRWCHGHPVLSVVCRIAAASSDRRQARVLVRGVCTALRGQDVPGGRILRRWLLPTWVVAARVASRAIPLMCWPLLLTSREIAGLLGWRSGR